MGPLRTPTPPPERGVARLRELPVGLELAWTRLADLGAMPRWHPGVRRVELGEGGLARGAALRLHVPWPGNAWVSRLEPPHRLELLFFPDGLGLRAQTAYTLKSLGEGRTRLTVELRLSGGLAPLLWPSLGRRAEAVLAGFERHLAAGANGPAVSHPNT